MAKRKITKEEFKMLYYSMTNDELAEDLNVTKQTVFELVKKFGIKPKGKGYHRKINIIDE